MKLYYASASPFVRKCLVTAIELGLEDRVERVPVATSPVEPDPQLDAVNPMRKIPALVTDEGEPLYDSSVICDYLDTLAGHRLIPAEGAVRWTVKRQEALADGLMDAAILRRYEIAVRPEDKQWDGWLAGQKRKVDGALDQMEREASGLGDAATLGTVAFGCALGYLDFRWADDEWRKGRDALARWYEGFAGRPAMRATVPSI